MILLIHTLSIINIKKLCSETEYFSGLYSYGSYQPKYSDKSKFIDKCLHGGSCNPNVFYNTCITEGYKYPQCVSVLYCTDDYDIKCIYYREILIHIYICIN